MFGFLRSLLGPNLIFFIFESSGAQEIQKRNRTFLTKVVDKKAAFISQERALRTKFSLKEQIYDWLAFFWSVGLFQGSSQWKNITFLAGLYGGKKTHRQNAVVVKMTGTFFRLTFCKIIGAQIPFQALNTKTIKIFSDSCGAQTIFQMFTFFYELLLRGPNLNQMVYRIL